MLVFFYVFFLHLPLMYLWGGGSVIKAINKLKRFRIYSGVKFGNVFVIVECMDKLFEQKTINKLKRLRMYLKGLECMDKLFVSDNSPKWIHQFLSHKSYRKQSQPSTCESEIRMKVKVNKGMKVKVGIICISISHCVK